MEGAFETGAADEQPVLGVQSKAHQSPRRTRANALLSAGCQDVSIIA
jgi:hypothetical protein